MRQRVIAHQFGQATAAADALAAAFRIPNLLQNLFGEGALSASLIPEYTKLRAAGRHDEAHRLAGAIAGLLSLVVTVVVALGVLAAPAVIDLLAPGFGGERRDLAIRLVRIILPGVGLLTLSAWCLGILNSHRKFFLSYAAPVGWNAAIIVATLSGATREGDPDRLVVWTAWGAAAGSLLQLLLQLPRVWKLLGGIRLSFDRYAPGADRVLRNFVPAALSRGAVQVSTFVDGIVASFLPLGSVAALTNAQLLYTLPVSLFGMSVAAADLPELSETAGHDRPDPAGARAGALRQRVATASGHVAFFIIPSVVAFLAFGHLIAGVVLRSGAFTQEDTLWVWGTLAGATVGLLAATLGRLYASAHFALGDTRTPLRCAVARVTTGVTLGVTAAWGLPALFGVSAHWGTAGLTLGSGIAGWVEFSLLRRSLGRQVGAIATDWPRLVRLWAAAVLAAAAGWLVLASIDRGWIVDLAALGLYGLLYIVLTMVFGVPTVAAIRQRFGSKG